MLLIKAHQTSHCLIWGALIVPAAYLPTPSYIMLILILNCLSGAALSYVAGGQGFGQVDTFSPSLGIA